MMDTRNTVAQSAADPAKEPRITARRLPVDGTIVEHETPLDGNVFADLGFEPEEAAHLLIRTDLMIEIERLIEERGLRQKDAASLFGVSQPWISDLVRGKIDTFTIDSLVTMLAHAGVSVELKVRRAA